MPFLISPLAGTGPPSMLTVRLGCINHAHPGIEEMTETPSARPVAAPE